MQLRAFGIDNEGKAWRELIIIYTEDNAFTVASKAICSNRDLTFAELKEILQSRLCGLDYKRALELKLRNLRFKNGTKIAPFFHHLRSTVQELYGLENEDSIDSIVISHIMSTLDETIHKETKVLQLVGNVKLESILELISEKLEGNILGLNITAFCGAGPAHHSSEDRGDRLVGLENMMANVNDKLETMQAAKTGPPMGR